MRKIAIITGASSGIGGATAVALAERGVNSIVTFNSHEDRVRDVVEAVRQRGAKAVPLRLDVGESASFVAFRDEVIAALDSEWQALFLRLSRQQRGLPADGAFRGHDRRAV